MSSLLTADIIRIFSKGRGKTLIVCVGNTLRRDDGVGCYIAAQLKSTPQVKIIDAGFSPENIIDEAIAFSPKRMIIIDAADFNGLPGEVRIIAEESIPLNSVSTHAIPLNVITGIIKDSVNCEVVFIGIQPEDVSLGEGICLAVKKTAEEIIRLLEKNLTRSGRCMKCT